MIEPEISPLARRLAEENNVDWRSLGGSGAGGKVVERDVLDYLQRVMSGEEAVDPTPEPLPAGVEAWPDQEPGGFGAARAAGTATGAYGRRTAPPEDDMLLLGEDSAGGGDRSAAEPEISEDIFLLDEDEEQWDTAPQRPDAGRADAPPAEPQRPAATAWPAGDEQAPRGASAGWQEAEAFDDLFELADESKPSSEPPEPVASARPQWGADPASPMATDAPASPIAADAPASSWSAWDDVDAGALVESLDEPGHGSESGLTVEEQQRRVAGLEAAAADAPERAEQRPAAPAVAEQGAPGEAAVAAAPAGAASLRRHGPVLRRRVDLSAVLQAQHEAAEALGRSAPVPLSAFLLRAATRAWVRTQGPGEVALGYLQGEGYGQSLVPDAAARPFADLAAACAEPTGSTGPADLAVVDLSELGIDDAVLDLDIPVLTLGRVEDDGAGRSLATLALSGASAPDQGARLLAAAAELLSSPVRLIL